MRNKIKNIATIQTGLFAKPAGIGDVVYLQSRYFDEYGQLDASLHPDLMASEISDKHLLRHGDVLFAAKGAKNFAAVYGGHNIPAVASTSFFVIRLTDNNLLPEYLAWFLNGRTAQAFLKAQAIGTSIPSISKQVLQSLEISVPTIEIQNAILEISTLRNREKALKQEIASLRELQIQQLLTNAIK